MGKKNNKSSKVEETSSDKSTTPNDAVPEVVPDEFKKVMTDFINDFTTTFPEYSDKLKDNFVMVSINTDGNIVEEEVLDEHRVKMLYEYSKTVYPVRFFDILYNKYEKWDFFYFFRRAIIYCNLLIVSKMSILKILVSNIL